MSAITFKLDKQSRAISLPFNFNVEQNLTIDAYTRNDTGFILMGDLIGGKLVEVDISHEKFSRMIPLDRISKGVYPVFSHHYLNADTIIVLKDISNEYRLAHDSVFYSVNIEGKENSVYSFLDSPFNKKGEAKDSSSANLFHHWRPMEFFNNKYFVNPLPLYSQLTARAINKHSIPHVGYLTFKGSKDLQFTAIPYIREAEHDSVKFAKEQLDVNFNPKDSNSLFVSHSNGPNLRLADIKSGAFTESNESGRLIPNPIPLPSSKDNSGSYHPNSTVFKAVLYDR
jgi:hypothetical protein